MNMYFGCVAFRLGLGLALLDARLSPRARLVALYIIVTALVIFGLRFYPRVVLAYSAALYLALQRQEQAAGIIVIVDALIGVQSITKSTENGTLSSKK